MIGVNELSKTLMRGFNKPLILWLIEKRDRHGYEIMTEFKRLTGKSLKPGILYPILHDFERKGYITGSWISKGRRRLRCYSITESGRRLLNGVREFLSNQLREFVYDLLGH
ncbi:MAG: PadR family transcriptional regulator [Candidatus Nezhaarchaeales archaeon]